MKNQTTLGGLEIKEGRFASPPTHIPDGNGKAYKTELAVMRSPERTEKIIWWHLDDPRPEPHNHPWDFESTILSGGYSEKRWWIEDGILKTEDCTYRAGDKNIVPSNVYHVVYDVQPGTVTYLICGVASPNNTWGYLNLETLQYEEATKDPNFWKLMCQINPHLIK